MTLLVPEGNVAGLSLKFIVNVTGCDAVTTLNVYDRTTFLKTFPYATGSTTLELQASDIRYSDPLVGIAASLSLTAEAICDDGRKNTSLPQPAIFFPVSKVVEDPQGGQVYAHPFAIDGTGSTMSFLSCGKATAGGLETMYRHGANGGVGTSITVPFPCNGSTQITDRNSVTGKRWVWTPGSGAFAIDESFALASQTEATMEVESLSVLRDGDALIRMMSGDVVRVSHQSSGGLGVGQTKWRYTRQLEVGNALAAPLVTGDNTVLIASQLPFINNRASIIVEVVDTTTGQLRAEYKKTENVSSTSTPPLPIASFSDDGALVYLGFITGTDQSQVTACVTVGDGCQGTNSKWVRSFAGKVVGVVPYASGSRVAAITTQRVWVLDSTTGAIRNKEQRSVDANGALQVRHLLLPASSTDLFFLSAPAPTGSTPTLPVEIVGMDQQAGSSGESRELFRYQVPVSLGAALDSTNRVWLRTGLKLLQTQPSTQYRSARPQ
ncbi:hypothetical protein LZ198_06670 [Myxococcus sp. K15C18031901]|uniref:hypothetical protein n=1 Tax=Myxococcus dinghuensis TaxID=2906761 RepID=UPI0020A77D9D|nr:hypothetical protein [Myxococcus dinghuensis]MCP3098557.1 hypothetical protein [Myxococcus dinghuensis]